MSRGDEMVLKKSEDHWAFLEEIEAPMWVDLTLEAKSMNQEFDDEWFHTCHPFHQCSSRQLKYAFSHSAAGNSESDFDLQGPLSPKLPSSVSRSRGKHYKSKNWGTNNCVLPLNKRHPVKTLSGKNSQVDSGLVEGRKLKSSCGNSKGNSSSKTSLVCESSLDGAVMPSYTKPISSFGDSKASSSSTTTTASERNSTSTVTSESSQQRQQKFLEVSSRSVDHTSEGRKLKSSCGNLKGTSISKTSLVCESSLDGAVVPNYTEPISSFGDLKASSSSIATAASESNSTSTVTYESNQQQQLKLLEVSSRPFDHTSGLLSALKVSLRKSCVTRQAARVEFSDGGHWQSKGRKSSSGKSSVGSSSNLGYGIKNMTLEPIPKKDQTPDSRNVMRMSQAEKNKVKVSNVSKASTVQVGDRTSNSQTGGKTIIAKSTLQEAAKSKVLPRTVHAKALVPLGVNEQDPLIAATKAKDRVGAGRFSRFPGGGKENAIGRMAANQKLCSKDASAGGKIWGQKVTKRSVVQKGERSGSTGQREKTAVKGKIR